MPLGPGCRNAPEGSGETGGALQPQTSEQASRGAECEMLQFEPDGLPIGTHQVRTEDGSGQLGRIPWTIAFGSVKPDAGPHHAIVEVRPWRIAKRRNGPIEPSASRPAPRSASTGSQSLSNDRLSQSTPIVRDATSPRRPRP